MTFGDNENDLAMLQMTPYGFAMKNAAAAFRQQAPQITIADNDHAGVLATIESLL
jgi:hydroxymethylpyrimidine pyrophosphatase-like HAD family hydrolase